VYGLGADATNSRAVAEIFEAKGRPRFNPLIVHVARSADARAFADFSPLADRLSGAFWPGPLTLVVQRLASCNVSDLVSAGLETIAVRSPGHPVAQALLAAVAGPIAAPSANRSGHVSATTAAHVDADLGNRVAMVLDGGPAPLGIESTVIQASGATPVLLRAGWITADAIERACGLSLIRKETDSTAPQSPGQLESHYAPSRPVRLAAIDVRPGEALLAFGSSVPAGAKVTLNLSEAGDLVEAAANLFAALRKLDAANPSAIAVMPIPEAGLGEAINDRLRRAAAPRLSAT
jgi:L-threonylcarbamoyladenylate synthase